MPELPEIETIRKGLISRLKNQVISRVTIRTPYLRYPVPEHLDQLLKNKLIMDIQRRGKYLLFKLGKGTLLIHLGMSGRLFLARTDSPVKKHDHVDIFLKDDVVLRYHDPRRFGLMVWTEDDPEKHTLLRHLGVEPLTKEFNGAYLFSSLVKRSIPIKQAIMNHELVVGVGNIYANEALFHANIHPLTPAHLVKLDKCHDLVRAIKQTLKQAIQAGGTTLKDFFDAAGNAGYFQQQLFVYGRSNEACLLCCNLINLRRLAGRSTYFCSQCQPLLKSSKNVS